MSTEICLHKATILNGYTAMKNCAILMKEHKIIDVFNEARFNQKKFKDDVQFIDVNGAYVAPGFIDTHIHGIGGYGTDDHSVKSILKMSEILPQYGVTSFIPTLYSEKKDELIKAIRAVVDAMGQEKGARILGMHLEGPFISPNRLGVQSEDSISIPDIKLFDELWEASEGHIINMTVAPELKGMRELALHCIAKGVILQAGHTNATYEQMIEGMQARIMHVTHLFNAMSRCEIIADGIHINPDIVKFLLRCKPIDKLVLVTDALKPTKEKSPKLYANGEEVYLDKCFYRKSDNVIAGSALTMIEGVKNLTEFGLTLEQAVQMASINPASIMKQEHLGWLAPGYDADLTVFDDKFNIMYTIIQGKILKKGTKECASS